MDAQGRWGESDLANLKGIRQLPVEIRLGQSGALLLSLLE
jgi:hypothetical protein